MPSQQSNLDSFFKVPKAKRVSTTTQTTLDSWKTKKSVASPPTAQVTNNDDDNSNKTLTTTAGDEEKENHQHGNDHDSVSVKPVPEHDNDDDGDDEDDKVVVRASKSRKKRTSSRRRIVDDDDDDDDDDRLADQNAINPTAMDQDGIQAKTRKKPVKAAAPTARAAPAAKKVKMSDDEQPGKNGKGDDVDMKSDDKIEKESEVQPHLDEKQETPKVSSFFQKKSTTNGNTKQESTTNTTTNQTSPKDDAKTVAASSGRQAESFVDEPLSYLVFCNTMEQIEAISGRLEIQAILTNLFAHVIQSSTPTDLYDLVYLSSNSVAPSYECIELGIGDAILIKAIGEAYGTNPSIIKQQYESKGDLGTVAKASKGKQLTLSFGVKPKPLLARDVLAVFRDISQTTGAQSQKSKVDQIKKLLVRAKGPEAKYIIRGLQGKLRIGLARSTVLISLAHAFCSTPPKGVSQVSDSLEQEDELPEEVQLYRKSSKSKSDRAEAAVAIIKKAYSEVPSYDALLDALLKVPLDQLHMVCTLTPGIPVEPMLAKPTKSIQEVLKRLNGQRFTCEYKYDGERAQVHMLEDGTFKVFSRNLLDTSVKYPEVPQYVRAAATEGVTSFVLDTEVVAFNRETGNLVPFQVLSTRKKTEESAETAKVQVIVEAFDLMYLNGKSLLNLSFSERRELLMANFGPVESKFQFAKSLDHTEDGDTTVLEDFLEAAVKGQCEGLMVKTLDGNAAYEPSKRSLNWLKLKKDYLDGLGDSVDLVPLGGYYGRGKRTGTFGAYLLACYDPETEEFQSVCKIGTGFSDEDLKNLSESFNDHSIDEKPSNYITSDTLACDVWFDTIQVWEVKAADLSKSSTHKGAIGRTGETGRGIGLRFPRFERLRDDKKPHQATTSEQILEMYYQQDSVVNEDAADGNDDDDGI